MKSEDGFFVSVGVLWCTRVWKLEVEYVIPRGSQVYFGVPPKAR